MYTQSSPYYTTPIVNDSYLDMMVDRKFPHDPLDVYWTITSKYQYRPDLLAYDLYADSNLWWVFVSRNPDVLEDPIADFINGLQIYIPNIDTLRNALGVA